MPRYVTKFSRNLPQGTLKVHFPNLAHCVFVEEYEAFKQLIDVVAHPFGIH